MMRSVCSWLAFIIGRMAKRRWLIAMCALAVIAAAGLVVWLLPGTLAARVSAVILAVILMGAVICVSLLLLFSSLANLLATLAQPFIVIWKQTKGTANELIGILVLACCAPVLFAVVLRYLKDYSLSYPPMRPLFVALAMLAVAMAHLVVWCWNLMLSVMEFCLFFVVVLIPLWLPFSLFAWVRARRRNAAGLING
jgi:hypothetical protein